MVGAAIHEAYAPTMPGRTLGYMVNLIAEDSGHNSFTVNRVPAGHCRRRRKRRTQTVEVGGRHGPEKHHLIALGRITAVIDDYSG